MLKQLANIIVIFVSVIVIEILIFSLITKITIGMQGLKFKYIMLTTAVLNYFLGPEKNRTSIISCYKCFKTWPRMYFMGKFFPLFSELRIWHSLIKYLLEIDQRTGWPDEGMYCQNGNKINSNPTFLRGKIDLFSATKKAISNL